MTFTQFLQVLAFNFVSNTLPLCATLYLTAYFIIKMYERRIMRMFWSEVEKEIRGREVKN